jgi:hypothetical protein
MFPRGVYSEIGSVFLFPVALMSYAQIEFCSLSSQYSSDKGSGIDIGYEVHIGYLLPHTEIPHYCFSHDLWEERSTILGSSFNAKLLSLDLWLSIGSSWCTRHTSLLRSAITVLSLEPYCLLPAVVLSLESVQTGLWVSLVWVHIGPVSWNFVWTSCHWRWLYQHYT